ncbi:MAG: oligoendopeptidase F [Clostridiales bacterium]|nr:oligoendopeptidase F [Clostridiales bacterium]
MMKSRGDIDPKDTWNLKDLYPGDKECLEDLERVREYADKLATYQGKATSSADALLEVFQLSDGLGLLADKAVTYIRLNFDGDMGEASAKDLLGRVDFLMAYVGEKLAFLEPELLAMEPEAFRAYLKQNPGLATYEWSMTKLFRQKDHVLSPSEEELMTRMGVIAGNFDKIFDDLIVNDVEFPEIPGPGGELIAANEANYRKAMESEDREFRRAYYEGLLGTYGKYINTICSALAANTHYHVLAARSRHYVSSLEKALAPNHIPLSVYDGLIGTLRDNLAPLQEYLSFRRTTLGYSDLHFYDLFVPLVKGSNRSYTFEEARDIVLEAVAPLGKAYQETMSRAFSERWVDIYPNKGKATGAYATAVYGVHPYSLLNFNGTLDDLFTIIHEMGHAMHSHYSNTNQPYADAGYCIFTAEVASTVNENLLFHYLLNRSSSPEEKAYLISSHLDSIRSTLYRQGFFADFERYMHNMVESGEPMTPQVLCAAYRELYALYYGPDFFIDDCLTYEWSRIPHFYRPFYVYQYATGISAAICLARSILAEGSPGVEPYLRFLSSGGSKDPIELLMEAGVNLSASGNPTAGAEDLFEDIAKASPVLAAIADFRENLTALKGLLSNNSF